MNPPSNPPFEILKREIIYRGKVFTVYRDDVRHESGYKAAREVVQHDGGAVVAPVFPDHTTLLVRQFRYPMQTTVLELPAGKLNPGEDPMTCAQRELEEETGWHAARLDKLTALMTTPGFCSEILHIYMATELSDGILSREQGEEDMKVEQLPIQEALQMCVDGIITDGKTIVGLSLAAMRLGLVGLL